MGVVFHLEILYGTGGEGQLEGKKQKIDIGCIAIGKPLHSFS